MSAFGRRTAIAAQIMFVLALVAVEIVIAVLMVQHGVIDWRIG